VRAITQALRSLVSQCRKRAILPYRRVPKYPLFIRPAPHFCQGEAHGPPFSPVRGEESCEKRSCRYGRCGCASPLGGKRKAWGFSANGPA
jgi:hypothetical protein